MKSINLCFAFALILSWVLDLKANKTRTADTRTFPNSLVASEALHTSSLQPDSTVKYFPGKSVIIEKTYADSNIDGYVLHLPESFHEKKSRIPILIFLQGSGATGGSIDRVNLYGIPNYLTNRDQLHGEARTYLTDSFIVVAPHVSIGAHIDEEWAIQEILDELVQLYSGDPERVYLTGLSFGGYSTWGLASKIPHKFAAIAPMAGGVWGVKDYGSMQDLPIWVGHCTEDPDMAYAPILDAVDTLELLSGSTFLRIGDAQLGKAGRFASDRIFTTFEKDSHDAWTDIYTSADFYKWLLSKAIR